MKSVLIITSVGDVHAYAVAEALRRKGGSVVLWHTSDYPSLSRETIRFVGNAESVLVRSPGFEIKGEPEVVWNRRPSQYVDPSQVDARDLAFAEMSCMLARRSLYGFIAPNAFWVNDANAALRARHKPIQQREAIRAGFVTPDTLYTNDAEEIRAFIHANGGKIIFKPYASLPWADEKKAYVPFSVLIGAADLVNDRLLQAAPGIFQAYVPKAFELRVTAMGNRLFAVKIDSQESHRGRIDWRLGGSEMPMEGFDLPRTIASRCLEVMERLGIVFGCFDLVVRPDGEYVFLEVNQMGQFLFLEEPAGIPLLDAFSEFLLQGERDFSWTESESAVSYAAATSESAGSWVQESAGHAELPMAVWNDGSSAVAETGKLWQFST